MAATDEQMIIALAQGSVAALKQLYRCYAGRVFSLALHLTVEQAAAEDITAAVFERLWQSAATYSPAEQTVAAWMMQLTYDQTCDWLQTHNRCHRHLPLVYGDHVFVAMPRDEPCWDVHCTQRGEAESLQRALRMLPREQREAILLAYGRAAHQRVAISSAAEAQPTWKSNIRRGMQQLHSMLRGTSAGGTIYSDAVLDTASADMVFQDAVNAHP